MTLMSDAWNGLRWTHDLDRWMTCATLEPEQDLHGQLDYKALRTLARGDIRHLVREGPRNAPHLEALK